MEKLSSLKTSFSYFPIVLIVPYLYNEVRLDSLFILCCSGLHANTVNMLTKRKIGRIILLFKYVVEMQNNASSENKLFEVYEETKSVKDVCCFIHAE